MLLFVWGLGFCVARRWDVIEIIKAENRRPSSVQEMSIVDIPIGKVSILSLSADSNMLVALVGAADLLFFSVRSLISKVCFYLLFVLGKECHKFTVCNI